MRPKPKNYKFVYEDESVCFDNEIWKEFYKTPRRRYEASNLGRVRTVSNWRTHILRPGTDPNGYLRIAVKGKTQKVHRIIATAYISNPRNFKTVNHKNGIKTDNRVENLEWCTHKDNMGHSHFVLGKHKKYHPMWGRVSAKSRPVVQLNEHGDEAIAIWRCANVASIHLKCTRSAIASVVKGRRKTVVGFRWMDYEEFINKNSRKENVC